jgi:hypothetical protein
LGKYMLRFVQYLVKQKWGEVCNGASSLPLSTTEAPQDTQEVTTVTSGPSGSAMGLYEDDSYLSSYTQGIVPDFYPLIKPDYGINLGLSSPLSSRPQAH